MKKRTRMILWLAATLPMACPAQTDSLAEGSERWTLEQCIQYAVEHNHDVRLQQLSLDDLRTERQRAAASFLPSLGAGTNVQYNFGRAIDPETNTYTNVSTFYNGYSMSASLPVFDGLERWSNLQTARLNVLLGRQGVQSQKDEVAQRVMRQYVDALYYQGAIRLAMQKRDESLALLRQACTLAKVGRRSEADTAQMRATYAADDYEVTRQQNMLSAALIALKQMMNYPADRPLVPDSVMPAEPLQPTALAAEVSALALQTHPSVRMAELNLQTARHSLRAARGAFFPSLSLGAGVSTTYYRQVGYGGTGFRTQFRNNAGEYVYASLSLPLFNRLNLVCNLRRQRRGVVRAREKLDASRTEVLRLVEEAADNHRAALVEMHKMQARVQADSLAARVTVRKFEEGLASPLDVQTATVALLQSRAALLQSRLGYVYVNRMLNYYKGIPLWTE